MLDAVENPRAVIGGNQPPNYPEIPDSSPTAIDRAKPIAEELGAFLSANPVLTTEDEARGAADVRGRFLLALKSVEDERDRQVRPLNDQLKAINTKYFALHNPGKKNGLWDKQLACLWAKMTDYALALERQRYEAEAVARRREEEAEHLAREAADREMEAREAAAAGVCDVDLAGAIEDAQTTSQRALKARWGAMRAEKETKVRITGGPCNAVSLKDHETLHVTDWKAAIEEMSDDSGNPPKDVADAILKCARAYRKVFEELPAGISVSYERSL